MSSTGHDVTYICGLERHPSRIPNLKSTSMTKQTEEGDRVERRESGKEDLREGVSK